LGKTLVLGRGDVQQLLGMDECIAAVEAAFRLHAEGLSLSPGVLGVRAPEGGFHIKAAGLKLGRLYFAAKTNANFSNNPQRHGLPAIQGVIVLCDADDGSPLAVMDSMEVTARRTAAATAVAAKWLARPGAKTATICGCGSQGREQLRALARVLPLRRAFAFDLDEAKAQAFARDLSGELGFEVTLDPLLMAQALVVVDILDQCASIGDLHHALEAGVLTREQVHAELAEVVTGRKPGRRSEEEITVFDSTGTALEDVAAAAMVYERAVASGRGLAVDLGS
jgi:alanine dehydrogenase